MLIDATAFWLYDNRESLMMEQDQLQGSEFRVLGFRI